MLTPIRINFGVIGTFLVFLLADYLRYKPIMVLNGVLGILAYTNLMGSPTIFRLKVLTNHSYSLQYFGLSIIPYVLRLIFVDSV